MPYVTGAQILTHVGKTSPTAEDTSWAGYCADAIEGAIHARLDAGGITPDTSGGDELEVAARTDGAALFNSKAAPHGVLSMGIDGEAVRLGADTLRATLPVIRRIHPTAGIGIG
jgi:hypothetical protein